MPVFDWQVDPYALHVSVSRLRDVTALQTQIAELGHSGSRSPHAPTNTDIAIVSSQSPGVIFSENTAPTPQIANLAALQEALKIIVIVAVSFAYRCKKQSYEKNFVNRKQWLQICLTWK